MRIPPVRVRSAALFVFLIMFIVGSAVADANESDQANTESAEKVAAQELKEEQNRAAITTSVTQAIQGESGISVQTMCTNCNSADLSVGAFSNHYIRMLYGILPVPAGLPQIYLLSVMPTSMIENVSVEKGAGRAHLGGGEIGGEISLRPREAEQGLQANVTADAGSYGWRGLRGDLSGRTGWFGGGLTVTSATSDAVDADSDGNPDMAAFDRTTWEGQFDLRPGKRHVIKIGARGYDESQEDGRAGFDFIDSDVARDILVWNLEQVEIEMKNYHLSYRYDFKDGSNITASWQANDRKTLIEETVTRSSARYVPSFDISEEYQSTNLAWFRPVNQWIVFRLGASERVEDYAVVDHRFNLLKSIFNPDFPLDFELTEDPTERGAWAEAEFSLGAVNLFAGVRYADFDYTDNMAEVVGFGVINPIWLDVPLPTGSKWLPRFALTWKPSDPVNLRFTYGQGYRQPPATFEEVCCGRKYRGNRGILMEESQVVGAEVTYQPVPALQINASAFRSEFQDMVIKVAANVEQFLPTYQNTNVPDARLSSLAVQVRWDASDWITLRGGGTWTDPENRTEDGAIPVLLDWYGSPRPTTLYSPIVPYIPKRNGTLSVQFREPSSDFVFNLSAQFAGPQLIQQFPRDGLPDTFIETPSYQIYNFRMSKAFRSFDLFLGADNLSGYFQTDLRDPRTDYTWGPLRGTYYYAGATYRFAGLGG